MVEDETASSETRKSPPRRGRPYPGAVWMALTDDMAALLRAEFARTGLGFATILDGAEGIPARLTPRIVRGWLYRQAHTVDALHWRYVVALLANAPDGAETPVVVERPPRKVFSNFPDHRALTDEERAALKFHRDRTGIGASVLLRGAADKPDGLAASMITSWMGEKPPRANPEYVRYVLERYEAVSDGAFNKDGRV